LSTDCPRVLVGGVGPTGVGVLADVGGVEPLDVEDAGLLRRIDE
jgi:hypothetical protein